MSALKRDGEENESRVSARKRFTNASKILPLLCFGGFFNYYRVRI